VNANSQTILFTTGFNYSAPILSLSTLVAPAAFTGITIDGGGGTPPVIDGGAVSPCLSVSNFVSLVNLQFQNCGTGAGVAFNAGSSGSSITSVTAGQTSGTGLSFATPGTYTVTNSLLVGATRSGIEAIGGGTLQLTVMGSVFGSASLPNTIAGVNVVAGTLTSNSMFVSNTFLYNNQNGVLLQGPVNTVTFQNNIFGASAVNSSTFFDGICMSGPLITGVTVSGNSFYHGTNWGLNFMTTASAVTITNNNFQFNQGGGINFVAAASAVTASGNSFLHNGVLQGPVGYFFCATASNIALSGENFTALNPVQVNGPLFPLVGVQFFDSTNQISIQRSTFYYLANGVVALTAATHNNWVFSNNGPALGLTGPILSVQGPSTNFSIATNDFAKPNAGPGLFFGAAATNVAVTSNQLVGFTGISTVAAGLFFASTVTNSQVVNNVFSNNAGSGLWFQIFSNGMIFNNRFQSNGLDGITGQTISGSSVTQNFINCNSRSGMSFFTDSPKTLITNNTITSNKNDGIRIQSNDNPATSSILLNVISGNTNNGIGQISLTGGITISRNLISGNGFGINNYVSGGLPNSQRQQIPQTDSVPQNAPILFVNASLVGTTVTVNGMVNDFASTVYKIEVYCNPTLLLFGQGPLYLGTSTFTTDGTTIPYPFVVTVPQRTCAVNNFISATLTNTANGKTSEFSNEVFLLAIPPSPSPTPTPSVTPTISVTSSVTPSITPTISVTSSVTASSSATQSPALPPPPSPSTSPSNHRCGDGVVNRPEEQCDYGSNPKPFWIQHCCNIDSCRFRQNKEVCGVAPSVCFTARHCSAGGVCAQPRVRRRFQCAPDHHCTATGQCKPRARVG